MHRENKKPINKSETALPTIIEQHDNRGSDPNKVYFVALKEFKPQIQSNFRMKANAIRS